MSIASPSTQSAQAFVFGLENDSKSHQRAIPSDLVDEDVDLEGDEKGQSMYVELLDGTQLTLYRAETVAALTDSYRDVNFCTQI